MEDSAESSSNPIPQGCGPHTQISIHISPTTGGDFFLTVDPDITVDSLKKLVSKKLKVPRDRLCLLFRDKQLQDGNLVQHGVADGSKVTLLPNVETGLVVQPWTFKMPRNTTSHPYSAPFTQMDWTRMASYLWGHFESPSLYRTQRPEVGIMQALESLNDTQVNEFLCGKAPLNLSMRLGDHMMLIQLQLSTVSGAKPPPASSGTQPTARPPSLVQASRNLQHTLRRLSADVFSGREESTKTSRRGSVYSGTFSGALNPALQDPKGRPRRDVATIVHILNDLLCSAPDLRRVSRRGVEETSSSSLAEQEEPAAGTSCSEDQNLRTRGKLEQLRLVMGERRERRRQRKQKPYSLPQSDNTDTVTA